MKKLNVLSYNIHKGMSFASRRSVLANIRESLLTVQVDIVFLQEVVGGMADNISENENALTNSQFEYLADTIWPHHTYGCNSVSTKYHHGNAILSKFPIKSFANIDISTNSIEKRGVLYAQIEIPEMESLVHCFNVHLNLTHAGRVQQTKRVCKIINETTPENTRIILAGDFNDWPQRLSNIIEKDIGAFETFKRLYGDYARTYPSYFPLLRLDRIYSRHLQPLEASLLKGKVWNRLSDHLPIYCQLELC